MQSGTVSQSSVDQEGKNQSGMRELLREYCENATVHGLKYTSPESGRGVWRRIFWKLACLTALGALIYTITLQIIGLRARPTLTHVSVELKEQMPFPAVTLCSLNTVRKSSIPPGYEDAVKSLFLQSYWLSDTYNTTLNTSYLEVSDEHILYVSHHLWPTLLACFWDGKNESCSKLFVTVKTDFGYCFTFNDRNSNSSARIAKRTGNKHGLTVIANIQQNEYILGDATDSAGLRVLLHGYNETPLVEGRGFDVAPGKATKVSLEMMTVKNLPPPFTTLDGSSCADMSHGNSPRTLALFSEYDLNACRFECRYDYIFKKCQCRGSYDPGNATFCSAFELFDCYKPRFDEFMDNDMYKTCNCPVPCEWSSYSSRVSMADYPSLALMETANETANYTYTEAEYRQNFLKLTIAYDAFMLETVEQVPKYSLESIISAFGGQMGMLMGASLLSFFEFLEFLIQLIMIKITRKRAIKLNKKVTK